MKSAKTPVVELDRRDGIATMTLNDPGRRNALSDAMLEGLYQACDELDRDETIGATIIRGAEGSFCSGAERSRIAGTEELLTERAFASADRMYGVFGRISALRAPTIAAVRGAAVGAGVNLMLSTDLRVVGRTARVIAGFGRSGIHPGGGLLTLAWRVGGREFAAGLGLADQEISGSRCAELGVAWEAVDDLDVEQRARELAVPLGTDPALARRVVASLRIETAGVALAQPAAVAVERASQLWSVHRRR